MKRFYTVLMALLLACSAKAQAQVAEPSPVAAQDFAIMAWGDSPSEPAQLYRMKQAGLNVSGFCKIEDLTKVHAAGLACFVTDPRINDYDWAHMPPEKTLSKSIEAAVKEIGNNPAALGFFLSDEPRPDAFHGLGQVVSILAKESPDKLAYVNLLPNYSSADYLQTTDYRAYLLEYLDQVHPPLLSYDNYSLFDGKMMDRFYTNLDTIRTRALGANVPFWNVVLANTHFGYMAPSEATLRLQVFASLAYGTHGIAYFTYFAPPKGNFRMAAVDQFGHRTPTWNMLRHIDEEVNALAPWLIKLKSTGVYYSSPVPSGLDPIAKSALVSQVISKDSENPPKPGELLIGEFKDAAGAPFLMIVNRDLEYSLQYHIELKNKDEKLVAISPFTGKEEKIKPGSDWLAPGGGALFRIAK